MQTLDSSLIREEALAPKGPGDWTLAQIQKAISRELPKALLHTRKQGGQTLTYIPWFIVNRILDKYAPGWTWEIRYMFTTGDRLFVCGRLSIPTAEGVVFREATGTELLKEEREVWVKDKADRQFLNDALDSSVPAPQDLSNGNASESEQEQKKVGGKDKSNRQLLRDEFGKPITEAKELAYGDPSSNAESMSFRRCAARFGLGLYLYKRD